MLDNLNAMLQAWGNINLFAKLRRYFNLHLLTLWLKTGGGKSDYILNIGNRK